MDATAAEPLGLTEAAQRLHCQSWQIGRLMDKGQIPVRGKVGENRYVLASDLDDIKAALVAASYLQPAP
jgi:hypothetical protein